MPTNTHYTDEQVETWIAEKYPMRGHRTGEMLRALLADRRRLERENSIAADILNVVSDAVEAGAIEARVRAVGGGDCLRRAGEEEGEEGAHQLFPRAMRASWK